MASLEADFSCVIENASGKVLIHFADTWQHNVLWKQTNLQIKLLGNSPCTFIITIMITFNGLMWCVCFIINQGNTATSCTPHCRTIGLPRLIMWHLVKLAYVHSGIIMIVADALAPTWYLNIWNHPDDSGRSMHKNYSCIFPNDLKYFIIITM